MKHLLLLLVLSTGAFASDAISQFIILDSKGDAKLTTEAVVAALQDGSTCLKDGVRVLAKSKNLSKKHCQKSTILGLRVIKAKNINKELYIQLTGLSLKK